MSFLSKKDDSKKRLAENLKANLKKRKEFKKKQQQKS